MAAEPVTHEEIVDLLGELDELLVQRILDTHATVAELAEAIDMVEAERRLGEQRIASSPRVAEVREILAEMMPENGDKNGGPIALARAYNR